MSIETKKLIARTLLELSRQKPIDKVKVKDVVDACHISRQTFYYHFQDLTDVMEWMMRQVMDQMLEESLAADSQEDALYVFVATVSEYTHGILPRLLDSQRRPHLEKMMLYTVRTYLHEMVNKRMPDLKVTYADLQVAIDFCSYGITGLLLEYGAKEEIDAEHLTTQIYHILNGSILQPTYINQIDNQ